MKLNPTRCTFGIDSGKSMGFIVSVRGIKANLKKLRAIMEMRPLQNISETQRLIGKVALLNRFVSKSTDKCLSLFRILRKVHPWNNDCDKAFQALKQCLSNPPLLSQPGQGDTLCILGSLTPCCIDNTLQRRMGSETTVLHKLNPKGADSRYP